MRRRAIFLSCWIKPAATEYRLAQPPGIGVLGMRDPGSNLCVDFAALDCSSAPTMAQAAQPIAKACNIFQRQSPVAAGTQGKAEEAASPESLD